MKQKLGIIALALTVLITLAACKSILHEEPDPDRSQNSESLSPYETPAPATDTLLTDIPLTTVPPNDPADDENSIVQTAEALIGIPFAENGATPSDGFDNSGFIYYVLRENGFINCPRLTADQAAMGTHIGFDQLKSGDLAFFSSSDGSNPDFGGIYIGEGQMIYSPMPGQTVKIADISSDYWKNSFVTGVSLS